MCIYFYSREKSSLYFLCDAAVGGLYAGGATAGAQDLAELLVTTVVMLSSRGKYWKYKMK